MKKQDFDLLVKECLCKHPTVATRAQWELKQLSDIDGDNSIEIQVSLVVNLILSETEIHKIKLTGQSQTIDNVKCIRGAILALADILAKNCDSVLDEAL